MLKTVFVLHLLNRLKIKTILCINIFYMELISRCKRFYASFNIYLESIFDKFELMFFYYIFFHKLLQQNYLFFLKTYNLNRVIKY